MVLRHWWDSWHLCLTQRCRTISHKHFYELLSLDSSEPISSRFLLIFTVYWSGEKRNTALKHFWISTIADFLKWRMGLRENGFTALMGQLTFVSHTAKYNHLSQTFLWTSFSWFFWTHFFEISSDVRCVNNWSQREREYSTDGTADICVSHSAV